MREASIRATLNLHAVLPRLGDLVRHDAEAGDIAGDWVGTVQLGVLAGPAGCLEFDHGVVRHHKRGRLLPSLGLLFAAPEHLNALFAGRDVTPVPWMGAWRRDLIRGVTALFGRLDTLMAHPERVASDPERLLLVTRLMMYAACDGVSVLSESDPECADLARALPEGVAELCIQDTDIVAHLALRDGVFQAKEGPAEVAHVSLELDSPMAALRLFQGEMEPMAGLASGEMVVRGLIPLIDGVSAIMDRLDRYLL